MNPYLYDDMYSWLAARGEADIDEALSHNKGYQEYREALEVSREMTQSQTQNQNLTEGLNRIRRWRDQYRSMQPPSPLEDVNQLAAKLEMTHAHPSGIAQLFASGHVRLDSLFRDTGVLKAAERHIGRVLDDQAAKRRISGVAELSLVVGVATWKGNALPVLLYPVSVTIEGDGLSTTIRFTGRVALNVAFVNTLREQGVFLDEDSLFDGASYDSGTPETSAMFARISSEASERISDFAIERQIVLGCFMDPSSQMISESDSSSTSWRTAPPAMCCWTRLPATNPPAPRSKMPIFRNTVLST